MRKKHITLLFTVAVALIASCKREVNTVLPALPDASVNFYNAAEALVSEPNLNLTADNNVFIDDTISARTKLIFSSEPDLRQVPGGESIGFAGGNNDNQGYQVPAWLRLSAGNHRFIFTGPGKHFIADTTMQVPVKSLNCFYLAESPENDAAYRVLAVQEKWEGLPTDPTKVLVRFINLCPDAGSFKCYQANKGREPVAAQLNYGTATSYIALDTAGAAKTGNRVILRLFTGRDTANIALSAGVPPLPGASFVAVIQGFQRQAARRVQTGVNTDGSPKYTPVTVSPNLRVNLRRTY